jgi:hypothetical protein
MPEEELAAKLEAPTVRPPSNPPVEEVREAKEEKSDDEAVAKSELREEAPEAAEADTSREVDTVPPMRAKP